jgi:hypothetical protein
VISLVAINFFVISLLAIDIFVISLSVIDFFAISLSVINFFAINRFVISLFDIDFFAITLSVINLFVINLFVINLSMRALFTESRSIVDFDLWIRGSSMHSGAVCSAWTFARVKKRMLQSLAIAVSPLQAVFQKKQSSLDQQFTNHIACFVADI